VTCAGMVTGAVLLALWNRTRRATKRVTNLIRARLAAAPDEIGERSSPPRGA
jgi:hypothetical protein